MTYLPLCSDNDGMCADRLDGGVLRWLHCVNTPQSSHFAMSFPIGHLLRSKRGCSSSLFTKGFLNASRKLNLILLQWVQARVFYNHLYLYLKLSSQWQSEFDDFMIRTQHFDVRSRCFAHNISVYYSPLSSVKENSWISDRKLSLFRAQPRLGCIEGRGRRT